MWLELSTHEILLQSDNLKTIDGDSLGVKTVYRQLITIITPLCNSMAALRSVRRAETQERMRNDKELLLRSKLAI